MIRYWRKKVILWIWGNC